MEPLVQLFFSNDLSRQVPLDQYRQPNLFNLDIFLIIPPSIWYIALSALATRSVLITWSEYFGILFKSTKLGFLFKYCHYGSAVGKNPKCFISESEKLGLKF